MLSGFYILKIKGEIQMQTILLITIAILGLVGIKNYIKVKNLENRSEKTFAEVEKALNTLERKIKNRNGR